MTFIESFTLMLALIYSICVLYTSGKKLGSTITSCIIIIAVLSAAYWPLLIALSLAVVVISSGFYFKPTIITASSKTNVLRQVSQHAMALSLFLVAIQYTLHTWLLVHQISPSFMRPDVTDAFLPIAAAIQLKAIFSIGFWDQTHPAGAVMLVTVVVTGIACKRAFCGWICPLGLAGGVSV
ncbi:4Fe-4S binding protein [Vibrio lentus]|nr:4Fe-4S binding protein [Vibrio lentus]